MPKIPPVATSTPYTRFTNLACETLKVGGSVIDPAAGANPDWFKGLYPYNVTATPAQAAVLARLLAQKLATYLIDASVVAKNCLRLAVPPGATIGGGNAGGLLTVPTALSTSRSDGGPVAVPYLIGNSITFSPGGATLSSVSGKFPIGTTISLNPAYLLQSDALIDQVARTMAVGYLDALLLALYTGFSTNAPVGVPGTPLTPTVTTAAITALTGASSYQGGAPVFFVFDEASALYLDTVATEPYTGLVGSTFVAGRRHIYSSDVLAEVFVSENVVKTGSGPTATHNIAFCPSALGLATAPAPAHNCDPNSTTPLTTAAVVSSTPVNQFIASVRYGLTASSGNLFNFNVNPFGFLGVIDNALGVRVES